MVQLLELASVRPKLSYPNGIVSDTAFTFGTVIMELVDGCTIEEVEEATKKLRKQKKPKLQQAPAHMHNIMPHFVDTSSQLGDAFRRMFLFPLSVGIHSMDVNRLDFDSGVHDMLFLEA